jgi:hypothetical protein
VRYDAALGLAQLCGYPSRAVAGFTFPTPGAWAEGLWRAEPWARRRIARDLGECEALRLTPAAALHLATLDAVPPPERPEDPEQLVESYRKDLVIFGCDQDAAEPIVRALVPCPRRAVECFLRQAVVVPVGFTTRGWIAGSATPTDRWPVAIAAGPDVAGTVRHELCHILYDRAPGGPPSGIDATALARTISQTHRAGVVVSPAVHAAVHADRKHAERRAVLVAAAWSVPP